MSQRSIKKLSAGHVPKFTPTQILYLEDLVVNKLIYPIGVLELAATKGSIAPDALKESAKLMRDLVKAIRDLRPKEEQWTGS